MREKSIQESSLIGGWSCLLDETPDKLCDSDGNWKCTPSTENKVCLPVCKKLTYDAGGFWNFTDGENSTLVYFIGKKIDPDNSEKSTLVFLIFLTSLDFNAVMRKLFVSSGYKSPS